MLYLNHSIYENNLVNWVARNIHLISQYEDKSLKMTDMQKSMFYYYLSAK